VLPDIFRVLEQRHATVERSGFTILYTLRAAILCLPERIGSSLLAAAAAAAATTHATPMALLPCQEGAAKQ